MTLEELVFKINHLHENEPLYKDSGLWQIRTDDMEEVILQQGVDEPFTDFIQRRYEQDNQLKHDFNDLEQNQKEG